MKKKILVAIMVAMTAMLCACGEKAAVESTVNPDDYVVLGDYKNMSFSVAPKTEFTEEDVEMYAKYYFADDLSYADKSIFETKGTVAEGDFVLMDYMGKIDGVAFDGGTATDAILEIGSGAFIDGFEDGLIGVSIGETVDLNLTFPENYFSADLAGQEVVYSHLYVFRVHSGHRILYLLEAAGTCRDVQEREGSDLRFILSVECDLRAVRRPEYASVYSELITADELAVCDVRVFAFCYCSFITFLVTEPQTLTFSICPHGFWGGRNILL